MDALRSLMKLLRPRHTSNRVARRRLAHLEFECLDQRLLPSTATTSMCAVTDVTGSATGFYLDPSNHTLYMLRSRTAAQIAPANAVNEFSAGLNSKGTMDLFAMESNGRIALDNFDGKGWQDLGQPMPMAGSFAAVDGGRAYFEGADASLWEYSPIVRTTGYYRDLHGILHPITSVTGGWQELWGPNAVFALDAVTERPSGVNTGRDVVFAMGGDGRLEAFTKGGWGGTGSNQWLTILPGDGAGNPQFAQNLAAPDNHLQNLFSAGLDTLGKAEVYWVSSELFAAPGSSTASQLVMRWDTHYESPWVVTEMPDPSQGGGPVYVEFLSGTTNGKLFLKTKETPSFNSDPFTLQYSDGFLNPVQERNDQGVRIATFISSDGAGTFDADELAAANPNTFFCHYGFDSPDTIMEYSHGYYYKYQIQPAGTGPRVSPVATITYSGVLASNPA
jgi:hypothetical protein